MSIGIRLLGLLGVVGLFVLLLAALLFSLRPSETTMTRSVGPGRYYAATLKVKDCGAVCSPSATVILHDLKNRIGKGDIEVFDGIGGWPIEVHWIGPQTMAVTFCDGSRYKVRSHIAEGNLPDNALLGKISVIVVNHEDMMVGGNAYCRFPEPDPGDAKRTFYND